MVEIGVTKAYLVVERGPHFEQRWADRYDDRRHALEAAREYARMCVGWEQVGEYEWRHEDGSRLEIMREIERVAAEEM